MGGYQSRCPARGFICPPWKAIAEGVIWNQVWCLQHAEEERKFSAKKADVHIVRTPMVWPDTTAADILKQEKL
eukprot:9384089-Lingulodinium_polyedra.AAC.1